MDNKQLVNDTITDLFKSYYKGICRCISYSIGNFHEAEDIASDIFVVCVEKDASITSIENKRAWLYGVMRYMILRYYSRTKPKIDRLVLIGDNNYEGVEIAITVEYFENELEEYRQYLSDTEYDIIVHKYALGFKNKDIARLLNISEAALDKRLERIKKKLKKQIQETSNIYFNE